MRVAPDIHLTRKQRATATLGRGSRGHKVAAERWRQKRLAEPGIRETEFPCLGSKKVLERFSRTDGIGSGTSTRSRP